MSIGKRIRFFRTLKGMTLRQLGVYVGFPEKTADIRIAQYESGSRGPKADLIKKLANIFDVSEKALETPDIDSYIGVMHTLFAMEDLYGLKIDKLDDEVCIRLNRETGNTYVSMFERFSQWQEMAEKCRNGEISKIEYDKWRYNYPEE
ncbi:MAG: helix-turn-helix transcriptional regulator [Ruminococcaceae bacterium]|nr:helix-turn-helix transcriptional regulator [Oscillospiraceae bacterium]